MLFMGMIAGPAIISSCEKNFGEINTNPNVVTTPDIRFLLSYAEDRIITYQGTEWIWESMEQLMRFSQHLTTDPYELTSNVNSRYNTYYLQVLPNLFEIRKQIEAREDRENYRNMAAITYVLQVLHGIKVTDMNGSIPYTESLQGRYNANFSPVYDSQQEHFNTWLSVLDNAIAALTDPNSANQASYGQADVFYNSDWTKWAKLANSLKLRIAARLELAENAKAIEIFKQVMQSNIGAIESEDAELSYQNVDYLPFGIGGEITYRSQRFGTTSMINFMKKVEDPRLPIYFEKNGLQGSYRDTLAKYGTNLPSFINPADPLIQFQGGPADFTVNPTVASYIKNPFPVGNNNAGNSVSRYFLISPINRQFFSPRYNNVSDGFFKDVIVSEAETALLIAEFIQKGYGSGIDTRGTASDWYNKGVRASIRMMNDIAEAAESETAFSGSGDAIINEYLNDPLIRLDGTNDLERIYIQQHLNFFRNPNEAFVFARRTGYPKFGSSYYGREVFNETIPRRFWLLDPGEVNRDNWMEAMQNQGFTPNAQDLPALNSERIWYDKPAPDFGEGD